MATRTCAVAATYQDNTLNSHVCLIVQPHRDPLLVLQEAENEVDGLSHHLEDLSGRHLGVWGVLECRCAMPMKLKSCRGTK